MCLGVQTQKEIDTDKQLPFFSWLNQVWAWIKLGANNSIYIYNLGGRDPTTLAIPILSQGGCRKHFPEAESSNWKLSQDWNLDIPIQDWEFQEASGEKKNHWKESFGEREYCFTL